MSCLSRHLFPLVLLSSSSHSPACVVAPVAFCHKLDRKIFTARIISACAALSVAGLHPARGLWVPRAAAGRDPARGEGHGQLFFSAQTTLWNTISSFEKLLLRLLKDLLAGFPGFSLFVWVQNLRYLVVRVRLVKKSAWVGCNAAWKSHSVTWQQQSGFEKHEVSMC